MDFDLVDDIYQQKKAQKKLQYNKIRSELFDDEYILIEVANWINKLLNQEQYWMVETYTLHFHHSFNFDHHIYINDHIELTESMWKSMIDKCYDKIINMLPYDQLHLTMGYQGIHAYPRKQSIKHKIDRLNELDEQILQFQSHKMNW